MKYKNDKLHSENLINNVLDNINTFSEEYNLSSDNGSLVQWDFTAIPVDVNDFTYSKKSHLKFFKDNYYDYDLFGEIKPVDDFIIEEYQKMLCYFFIQKYIPAGSKLLQLGNDNSEIFDNLKIATRNECWKLDEIECLFENSALNEKKLNIYRYGDKNNKLSQPWEYFDFIFSISDFDNIKLDNTGESYKIANYNFKRLLRPGGYANFMFTVALENEKYHLNNFLYSFFTEYFTSINYTLNYLNPNSIQVSSDMFFNDSESNKYAYINFSNKDKICNVKVFSQNILVQKKVAQIQKHSNYKPSDYRKKIPAYFFHHLIKCGGSSLGAVLSNWFNFHNDLYDYVDGVLGYEGNLDVFLKYKYNIENLTSDTCVRGHFQHENIFIDQRYPEIFRRPDEFKVFTFVRDPIKTLTSLYYFGKKREYDYKKITLKKYFKSTKNFLAYLLNCNESNYKEILDRYYFIGIVDKMQESFDKLAELTGKKKILVPTYNTTEKDDQIQGLTENDISEIKEMNALDYKIYNYCLEKFDKL